MRRVFITGVAGFIGSTLTDELLAQGLEVVGWDNWSTGRTEFVENALTHPQIFPERGDNLDLPALTGAMRGCDFVFHLAANADVRFGLEHPSKDFEQNSSGDVSCPGGHAGKWREGNGILLYRIGLR